jgi:hypothetical protein
MANHAFETDDMEAAAVDAERNGLESPGSSA